MRMPAPVLVVISLLVAGIGVRADPGDAKTTAAKEELKKLEGAWVVVSREANGKKTPEEQSKGKLVFKGDRISVCGPDGEVIGEASLTIDPTKKPKHLDLTITKGTGDFKKYEGKKSLAIYELDGDTLKACWTVFGAERERPTAFATKPASGLLLIHYKREKK
jgi:uncharacterized protein (TIGR03067 family)